MLQHIWIRVLLSVGVVSAIPLAGFAAVSREALFRRAVPGLVSLAVGAMMGSAMLELTPEAFQRLGLGATVPSLTLAGFISFFLLERLLSTHEHWFRRPAGASELRPFVVLNLVGDTVHNAIDGMVIAASYAVSPAFGMSTTIAVVLHEVPHEMGDFGVLVRGGLPVRQAVLFNAATALAAIAGAVVTLLVGARSARFSMLLLPVAAGSFIYVAAADLIPELHRERAASAAVWQCALMLLGVAFVMLPQLVAAG